MKSKVIALIALTSILLFGCKQQPAENKENYENSIDLSSFKKKTTSSQDLSTWNFWGMGKAFDAGNGQFCLMENDSTLGVTLISPDSYAGDLIIRYKTLALTPSTVLVVMHSASDKDSGGKLTIPEGHDGSQGIWVKDKDNYFYAFRNAPHNATPFIRKYPLPGNKPIGMYSENIMLPGIYYAVEIGKIDDQLWLSINNNRIIETSDENILPGGHIAFRVRGSAGLKAACLIKDLEIFTK